MADTHFDICITWNWEYDSGFLEIVRTLCAEQGIRLLEISDSNLKETESRLLSGKLTFSVLLDRASDSDPAFFPITEWATRHQVYLFNPAQSARRSWDKALMHYQLIRAGLLTPHTLIFPAYKSKPAYLNTDLSSLGIPFVIKPSLGGGGVGVFTKGQSLQQIHKLRMESPYDTFLVQSFIKAKQINDRQAWFRNIYCLNTVFPCWWDTRTHVYIPVTSQEECSFDLAPLRSIMKAVAQVCELNLFSSEIALTENGRFVIVDYVNDPIDLRLSSTTQNGVPDEIVKAIAGLMLDRVALVKHQLSLSATEQSVSETIGNSALS